MKINPNDMVLLTSGMTVRATTPVEGGKFQGKAIVGDPAMPPLEYSLSDVFATFKFTGHHNELVQQMIDQEGIQALHENIFLSARGNSSNTDVLVVRFRSASQMSGEAFLASLRQAVTRWMMQTYEGRVAWEKAEGHFFLEHLIPSLEDRHLPILLSNFGINELKIAVLTDGEFLAGDSTLPDVDALMPTPKDPPETPASPALPENVETEEEVQELDWDSGRKDKTATDDASA